MNESKKILVVEDDQILNKVLVDYLKPAGFLMISAFEGEEALVKTISEKPDLILLDIMLPKINGYDVLKSIRKNNQTKNIPVILLTNLDGVSEIQKAFEIGATTYLVKSEFKLEEVADKIKKILNIK